MDDTNTYRLSAPYALQPGQYAYFRNAGTGPVRFVRVLPRGPLGQFMVWFEEARFALAVSEGSELFEIVH